MTQIEIEYVEKLKEINTLLRGPRYYEVWSKILRLEIELKRIGKQCQFEILCNPDIFEASANEHFDQEEKKALLMSFMDYYFNSGHGVIYESDINAFLDERENKSE